MIPHQRMSLNSKSNIKGTNKKVMRCGNQRVLYTLVRRKFLELFRMFLEIHVRGCDEDDKYIALTCFILCWVSQHHPHPRDKQGSK